MGFGDMTALCQTAPIPMCAALGPAAVVSAGVGIEPDCFARNIELANTIIFEGAVSCMHIVALIMTSVMLLHVRSKFTAIGRKEITSFFGIYMLLTFVSLLLDSGVVLPGTAAYPYFCAVQNGLSSALVTCLLVNGFVGYQLYSDGTRRSVWVIGVSSAAAFATSFLVSLGTFRGWPPLSPTNTVGLFVVLYLLNALQLFVYVLMQVLLVTRTMYEQWPLGSITIGLFSFVAGQVLLYAFSVKICDSVSHYMDGLFFATVGNLLGVMMVYKYWDSITREDLEFSVGTKNPWEAKELLAGEDARRVVYGDDPGRLSFPDPQSPLTPGLRKSYHH